MSDTNKRKTDRRTLYTRRVIKEAFLSLKKNTDFNSITISALCREAQLNRGTFYLHYRNTAEVLDEILEDILGQTKDVMLQLSLSPTQRPCRLSPFCTFMRQNTKYHCIFLDDSLSSYLVEKVLSIYKEDALRQMAENSSLSSSQLEAILYFQFSGCFAAAKKNIRLGESQWEDIQLCLDAFIQNGLRGCLRK